MMRAKAVYRALLHCYPAAFRHEYGNQMVLVFAEQLGEARQGCVPVRRSVMRQMQSEADEANRARLAMLERVIADHILVPPKFARYPEVEEVLWRTVQRAFTGEMSIDDALGHMRQQIKEIVKGSDRSGQTGIAGALSANGAT